MIKNTVCLGFIKYENCITGGVGVSSRPGWAEARCSAGRPATWGCGHLRVPHGPQVGKEDIGRRGGGGGEVIAVAVDSSLAELLAAVRTGELFHLAL